jgi:hypothetical protein
LACAGSRGGRPEPSRNRGFSTTAVRSALMSLKGKKVALL